MNRPSLIFVTLAGAAALPACSADRPGGNKADAGMEETLDPPTIDTTVPMTTPNGTVAIRGTTSGSSVVVKGSTGDPVIRASLPTGGFCVDAPLQDGQPTLLNVFALKDGLISTPTLVTVTKDPNAPIPASPMCQGEEQPVCVDETPAANDCADGKDNNCNGFTDACDTTCNGCKEDALGPNWTPFFVPMIAPGTYNAEICPCRDDWFAFGVNAGEVIHVKATFSTAEIDLDMKLQTASDAEMNSTNSVASSVTTTATEEINYTATANGLYYLKIYSYKKDDFGAYKLTIY